MPIPPSLGSCVTGPVPGHLVVPLRAEMRNPLRPDVLSKAASQRVKSPGPPLVIAAAPFPVFQYRSNPPSAAPPNSGSSPAVTGGAHGAVDIGVNR